MFVLLFRTPFPSRKPSKIKYKPKTMPSMPRTYVKTQSPADPFSKDKCFHKEEGVGEKKRWGYEGRVGYIHKPPMHAQCQTNALHIRDCSVSHMHRDLVEMAALYAHKMPLPS